MIFFKNNDKYKVISHTENIMYDIAISYTRKGKKEPKYAKEIAKILKEYGLKVFFDEFEVDKLWGRENFEELYDIFANRARYVVAFISKNYMENEYTFHELRAIKTKVRKTKDKYIPVFIISFDNQEIKGLTDSYSYLDGNKFSPKEIATKILKKINNDNTKMQNSTTEIEAKKFNELTIFEKIIRVFEIFDINKEEIPLILKWFDINFYDLFVNEESFKKKISPDMIKFLSKNFKINLQAFYGNSRELIKINNIGFYKNVKNFGDNITSILKREDSYLYILSESIPCKESEEENNFILLIKRPLFNVPETQKQVYTFDIYHDGCWWGYWKCRYNLKSLLIYLRKKHQVHFSKITGYSMRDGLIGNMYSFSEGNLPIKEFFNPTKASIWYPEDYVEFPSENVNAKESDELEVILNEINKDKWVWY